MTSEMLDEYVKITKIIDKIHEKINAYKVSIEQSINNTNSKKKQEFYMNEFKIFINQIKNDMDIINKYKLLKTKQKNLRNQILNNQISNNISYDGDDNDNDNDVDKTIFELRSKYEVNINTSNIYNNTNITPLNNETVKFDLLINDVQKNLDKIE
jgi:hypothetical protein